MGSCSSKTATKVNQTVSLINNGQTLTTDSYAEFHNDKSIPKKKSSNTEGYYYK